MLGRLVLGVVHSIHSEVPVGYYVSFRAAPEFEILKGRLLNVTIVIIIFGHGAELLARAL